MSLFFLLTLIPSKGQHTRTNTRETLFAAMSGNVGVGHMQSLMRSDLQQADEAGERWQSTGSSGKAAT